MGGESRELPALKVSWQGDAVDFAARVFNNPDAIAFGVINCKCGFVLTRCKCYEAIVIPIFNGEVSFLTKCKIIH